MKSEASQNSEAIFRRGRLRLALWYAGVMGLILTAAGLGLYRAMVQANWTALEREIESIAGTLHDSVEPLLPVSEAPTAVLKQIFPDLCLAGQPCNATPTLIERHTLGISDRSTYYIRLFDAQGKLLAFSPNQPSFLPESLNPDPWQTLGQTDGIRYRQFTTILHGAGDRSPDPSANASAANRPASWGYLQIGRTLAPFDAEVNRFQWIFAIGLPTSLGLVALSSWLLSGLAMQPIYQSYQQQQQFTANAAHELRSPLASLLATLEAMIRLPVSEPETMTGMLHTVERQGRRLSQLIADLLLLTSLEQNASPQPLKPCCLNDLISDLAEEFSELAQGAEIQLSHQLPPTEIYALGHESQLYRLVSNLIANGIQYTPAGGQVSLELKVRDRMAVITVKDSGIGIAPREQAQIFDRFYRVDSARSRQTGGTGLGLAIARAIGDRHQGSLTVESQLGQGSAFTLRLPVHEVYKPLSRGQP